MGDVSSPLRPSPPELEKSGLTMLFYGIFIVGIAAIVFTTYNFILIRWCTNNRHPLPTQRPARRGETVTAPASIGTEAMLISINRKKIGLLTSSFKYKKSAAPEDEAAGRRQFEKGRLAAEQQEEEGGGGDEENTIHSCNIDDDDDEEGCAVCLSLFEQGEELRQLPNCNHTFHAPCIDMWLYSHLDCPLCRTPLDFTCLLTAHDHQGETRIQVVSS